LWSHLLGANMVEGVILAPALGVEPPFVLPEGSGVAVRACSKHFIQAGLSDVLLDDHSPPEAVLFDLGVAVAPIVRARHLAKRGSRLVARVKGEPRNEGYRVICKLLATSLFNSTLLRAVVRDANIT
jgi:hypothetical protein